MFQSIIRVKIDLSSGIPSTDSASRTALEYSGVDEMIFDFVYTKVVQRLLYAEFQNKICDCKSKL